MKVVFKPGAKDRKISELEANLSFSQTLGVKNNLLIIINTLKKDRIFKKTFDRDITYIIVETSDIENQRVKVENSEIIPWISSVEVEYKEKILQL